MGQQKPGFPSYDNPPVIEVALSVEVDPPTELDSAHAGYFWSTVKADFPLARSLPPIPATTDNFRDEGQWLPPQLKLQLSDQSVSRVQMVSADDQWMWQVQPDRLVVNWRKRDPQYPRYERTRERFEEAWRKWEGFLKRNDFGPLVPRFWQVTYVNRIPAGEAELWQAPDHWPEIFPGLWGGEMPQLRMPGLDGVRLHGLRGVWVWNHQEPPALLSMEARPSRSGGVGQGDLLMMNVKAWGPVAEAPEGDPPTAGRLGRILAGLDGGRELIVKAFDAVASPKAHEHWGRHDALPS